MFAMGLLFVSIIIAVAGQFLFKTGAERLGDGFDLLAWITNVPLLAGFAAYFASALLYIITLRTIPLSVAFPTLALGYVLVVGVSVVFLHEPLSMTKGFAVCLICIGVGLLWT